MANKQLFQSQPGRLPPATNARNEAGGKAARPDGSPYRVDEGDRTGLLGAATPGLWDELAARMAGI